MYIPLAKTYVSISKTPIEIDLTPREKYNSNKQNEFYNFMNPP